MSSIYTRRPRTDYIAIHAAATDPNWHGDIDIDDIRGWHVNERGWIDVGYHLYIPYSGVIQLGRPLWAMGAHVSGYNDSALGICLEGGATVLTKKDPETGREVYDGMVPTDKHFTEDQFIALRAATSAMLMLNPDAKVQGHTDFPGVTKACPAFDAIEWWEQSRPLYMFDEGDA